MDAKPTPPTLSSPPKRPPPCGRSLAALPLDYETLLVGKYMDGLSLDDLAEAEDTTLAAVSSKLARARRAFREAFEKLAPPTPTRSVSEGSRSLKT